MSPPICTKVRSPNSHAIFVFTDPKGKVHDYPRVVNELPKEPKEIKPHPHGVELGTLMHLLEASRGTTVSKFLKILFHGFLPRPRPTYAKTAKVKGGSSASKAGREDAEKLYNAIQIPSS